jgi:hypothetical protein
MAHLVDSEQAVEIAEGHCGLIELASLAAPLDGSETSVGTASALALAGATSIPANMASVPNRLVIFLITPPV